MGIIDKVDNFNLLRRKRVVAERVELMKGRSSSKSKGCMPTSERLKEMYVPAVTHIKMK